MENKEVAKKEVPEVPKIIIKIIEPHKTVSRPVEVNDLPDVHELYTPCQHLMGNLLKTGAFSEIYAIAHAQVEKKNPLRFFVFNRNSAKVGELMRQYQIGSDLIINPEIIRHTRTTVSKNEGCLTFVGMGNKDVDRWHKITVKYQVLMADGYTLEERTLDCSGVLAEIFQHEIDHFDAKYIHTLPPKKSIIKKAYDKLRKS